MAKKQPPTKTNGHGKLPTAADFPPPKQLDAETKKCITAAEKLFALWDQQGRPPHEKV